MTKPRLGSSSTVVVVGVALVCGGSLVIGSLIGPVFSGWGGLALLAVVLGLVAVGHVRFVSARMCRTQGIINALQEITDGSSRWRKNWPVEVRLSGLGDDMCEAVETLSDRIDALRREKRRAELVLAHMTDGLVSVDCMGRITLVNRAALMFFGRKEASLIGKTLGEAELHPEFARMAQDCLSSRNHLTEEITLPGPKQRVLRIHAEPFHSAVDSPECAIFVIQDLTEARRHERYQKEFASNVSHELRTPITAIRSTAETLLSGAMNDEAVAGRFLSAIMTETERLSALIDDIMEIAKLDSGALQLQRSPHSVEETVEHAVSVLRLQAQSKRLALNVHIPRKLIGSYDQDQIVHVVRNLVDNAVKYTPEGGAIDIGAELKQGDLRIWVKDTGIGIPHGEVDRVFARFYRVDKARSRAIGGTGLGLAIVKDIVGFHEGKVTVDTELGRGSTFTIILPQLEEVSTGA